MYRAAEIAEQKPAGQKFPVGSAKAEDGGRQDNTER